MLGLILYYFFFSSRRRHTRSKRDWSSDVCSSDLGFDINGELSDAKTIDYHAVTDNKNVPDKIPVDVSYYDDNGSDEPYIDIKWPVNKNISSYEVQYRLKIGRASCREGE